MVLVLEIAMRVHMDLPALKKTKLHEYAIRFLFGGAVTVIAGLLAKKFGPVFGGLFLAFPAIFPASATLVEKHEIQKKQKAGITFTKRGRQSAAVDAYGAALGSIGLMGFAFLSWKLLPRTKTWQALLLALLGWLAVNLSLWRLRKTSFH